MARLLAVALPSTATAAAFVRASWDRGDAILPLDPKASRGEVDALLSTLRPDRLVTLDDPVGTDLPAPHPTPDDVALVAATSGSTGQRKGVELTSAALEASTSASLDRLGATNGDRWCVPLPLHHVAGLAALRRAWALGTEPEIVAPGDLRALLASDADHVAVVPTQLYRWLEHDGMTGPRRVLVGGAAPPPRLLSRAGDADLRVTVSYGMTETCGGCVYDGRPLDGVEVRLDGHGRVQLRGAVRFAGYRADPAATAAVTDHDGWFTTGDLGTIDDDGRLVVLGRADDIIVSGGRNIPLPAVVAALRTHPAVADVAAMGVVDDEWGEVVHVVVVPTDAGAPPHLDDLRDHVRTDRPSAFAPRGLTVVAELPRDAMGKVTRATLRSVVDTTR